MINEFIKRLEARLNEYRVAMGYTYFSHYIVTAQAGQKFTKVFRTEVYADGSQNSRNIVAFVDIATGDIFKPASFKAPAKHARGNVNSPEFGMEAIEPSGFVRYLRGM